MKNARLYKYFPYGKISKDGSRTAKESNKVIWEMTDISNKTLPLCLTVRYVPCSNITLLIGRMIPSYGCSLYRDSEVI